MSDELVGAREWYMQGHEAGAKEGFKIGRLAGISEVTKEIEKIVKKYGNKWDSIEVNWPLELIHNAIRELINPPD